jgi:hypothetical protein
MITALLFCMLGHSAPANVASARELAFPMAVLGTPSREQGVDLELREDELGLLRGLARVRLSGIPLPDGSTVVLDLERVELDLSATEVRVDGARQTSEDAVELSAWSGRVLGEEGSDVFLAFSPLGSRGWIRRAGGEGELLHLLAGAGGRAKLVDEEALVAAGAQVPPACANDRLFPSSIVPQPASPPSTSATTVVSTIECKMAIETDYQLRQHFGSLASEQNYLQQLFAAASARYQQQLDVRLELAYLGLHGTANDGWVSGDNGAGSGAMLDEFRIAWTNQIPNGAHLAHFLSGANLGGGVAYVDVLCSPQWGFAVSGNLGGNMPFPPFQGPLTWDFYVFTHETGHNFGSPHTQDFCPPLDQCVASCAPGTVCTNQGTIMSYCHLCPGGMNNITLYLHPTCVTLMRQHAENSCLPDWCTPPVSGCFTTPNSFSASGAQIGVLGTSFVSANDLDLYVVGVPPGSTGVFVYGPNEDLQPFGNGWLCVGSPFTRLGVATANLFGDTTWSVDLNALPASGSIQAGDTRVFQLWFRDPAGGGAGFDLSDSVTVAFCP